MNRNFDELVRQSIAVTLENMAFMEVLPQTGDTAEETAENSMSARLLVLDPVQAELVLTVPVSLLGNVIDVVHAFPDDEVVEQIQTDMLGELLNTVAGRLLNDFLPGDQTYRLGLPEVCRERPVLCDGPRKTWKYDVEGDPLSLTIIGCGLFPTDSETA
ncbi:MAG: hypothetical protein PHC98_03750 [Syntrophotalea acetylenica]|jgi:hypothetical protein|uniref:Chemotaxis phosphatase CheX-like domain-containing protein n=1 Tax=Syntrophotalea acetylenica TaxID=29542 RepID=A0A1L3GCM9_SYNAC|nr:hypothetical protein [Syntrophotalea acetylenica]APG23696.1 hypothetical protein A7E75_00645 [Syntrophotalea acetylenica]APG44273.1 hypothetical protein A6070_09255 [Syntrophotalea acetylenica]MDD4456682.1 hypothetical protein [Syntrophotalea acetylenica]MDY0262836.1 hypothetical protein [Syntrophotalea acetylenica]